MRIDGPQITGSFSLNGDGVQDLESLVTTSSLNTYTSSMATTMGYVMTATQSLNTFTSSANSRIISIEGKTGSFATTGSNTFNGNLTVTGYIDTQELRTTFISSSILYRSGSTKFGDESTDTHSFTGSLTTTTSVTAGNGFVATGYPAASGNGLFIAFNSAGTNTGSLYSYNYNTSTYLPTVVDGSSVLLYNSGVAKMGVVGGNVGINKVSSLNATLDVNGNTILSGSLTTTGRASFSGTTLIGEVQSSYALIETTSGNGIWLRPAGAADPTGLKLSTSGAAVFSSSITGKSLIIGDTSSSSSALATFQNNANGFQFGFASGGIGQRFVWNNGAPTEIMSLSGNGELRLSGSQDSYIYLYGQAGVKPYIKLNEFGVADWVIAAGHPTGKFSITKTIDSTDGIILDSSGRIGLGSNPTSSRLAVNGSNSGSLPLVDLTASGTGTFQRGVRLLNSGMNSGDHILYCLGKSDNSRNMGQVYFYYYGDGSTSNALRLGLHSVDDVMSITANSNVIIGTTTDNTNTKVYIRQGTAQGATTPAFRVSYVGGGDGNPQNVAMFTNDATLATSAYLYIGAYSGADWYIGKNVAGSSANYNFQLGTATNNILGTLTTSGVWSTTGGGTSDRRVKQDIIEITQEVLPFINELKPVSFKFKEDSAQKTRRGFIAQDVLETSMPDLVLGDGEEENGTYGLDYDGILSLAIKAIQELKQEINLLKANN